MRTSPQKCPFPRRIAFLSIFYSVLMLGGLGTSGQTPPNMHATATVPGQSGGTVVLEIVRGSETAKAGIRPGDILFDWKQAGGSGAITSPLDLAWLERERAPRGPVILTGQREAHRLQWVLNGSDWGIMPGPHWADAQPIHLRMRELASAGRMKDLEEFCRSACAGVNRNGGEQAWLLFEAGYWIASSDDWKHADEFYAAAIHEIPSDLDRLRGVIDDDWGDLYKRHNDWSTAEKHYSFALSEDSDDGPESLSVAHDLYMLAQTRFHLGDFSQADLFATRALHILRKLSPESLEVAKVLNYLGAIAMQSGDLDSADDFFHQSLRAAERMAPNSREVAFADNNLGVLARKRGDFAAAEGFFLQDMNISSRLNPNDYLLSYSWANLGMVAFERGDLAGAKEYYMKALSIQEKRGTEKDRAMTLASVANVFEDEGDLGSAERDLREAVELQERTAPNSVDLATSIDALGSVLKKRGRFEEAKTILSRALDIRQAISANSLEVAESLEHLADLYLQQGVLENAENLCASANQIYQTLAPKSRGHAEALFLLATVHERRRQWNRAIEDYQRGTDVLNVESALLGGTHETQLHFHATYATHSSRYVSLLMQQRQVNRAFEVLEKSRAQVLLRMLDERRIQMRLGGPPAFVKRDRQLQVLLADAADGRLRALMANAPREEIAAVDEKIANYVLEDERLQAQLRVVNPRYAALAGSHPRTIPELQKLLDSQTLVLEYSLGTDDSYVFVLTGTNLQSFALPGRSTIETLAKKVYQSWSVRNGEGADLDQDAAAGLSAAVLAPVADLLNRYRRIVVVPDGALRYVPFAALPVATNTDPGTPLMANHELIFLPSVSVLSMLRERPSEARPHYKQVATIIGDPVFDANDPRVRAEPKPSDPKDGTGRNSYELLRSIATDTGEPGFVFPRLLYSRPEADAIASLFSKDEAYEALDFRASRKTVLSPGTLDSRILHFATHTFLDSRNPEISGLVLSMVDRTGKPRDGLFTLRDVFNSTIPANLVVLSACQTALGEEVDGEGLVGLTWGLMYAGVDDVIASLWNVNDAATAELMRLFYEALLRKKMPPGVALRNAQLAMSRDPRWASPFFWAGFTLEGDWTLNLSAPRSK